MADVMPNPNDVIFDDGFTHVEFATIASGNVVKTGEILAQDANYKWKPYASGDEPRGISLSDTDASTADATGVVGFFGSYNINNVYADLTDSFSGDGTTTTFTLTATAKEIESVSVGGVATTDYTFDASTNAVTFTTAPATGTDNVSVTYKAIPGDAVIQALRDKAIYLEEVKEY